MSGNGSAPDTGPDTGPDAGPTGADRTAAAPVVSELDTDEARTLAALASVFDDLQYVLLCCEQLMAALAERGDDTGPLGQTDAALIEALWTGALVGYVRCFSGRTAVLTDDDVAALELEGETQRFHAAIKRLRDHYASRHENPREAITVGVALADSAEPQGVAVLSAPHPAVDDATVRGLGRIAFALRARVDERIDAAQKAVLDAASAMPRADLLRLPQVQAAVG